MNVVVSEAVFRGVVNFRLESLSDFYDNGQEPYAGVVDMIPAPSLPAVRAFIAELLSQNLNWSELSAKWRDAGSNLLFGSEEQMRAFLAEVLRQVELRLAKA